MSDVVTLILTIALLNEFSPSRTKPAIKALVQKVVLRGGFFVS